jgi:hypothetical protein
MSAFANEAKTSSIFECVDKRSNEYPQVPTVLHTAKVFVDNKLRSASFTSVDILPSFSQNVQKAHPAS